MHPLNVPQEHQTKAEKKASSETTVDQIFSLKIARLICLLAENSSE